MMAAFFRFLFLLFLLQAPCAWCGTVALVLSDYSKPYLDFQKALSDSLNEGGWKTVNIPIESASQAATSGDIVVAAGSEALRKMLTVSTNTPVLATLIPRQAYERLIAENAPIAVRKLGVIHLDQPFPRQAAFVKNLLPDIKRLGILISPETKGTLPRLRQLFAARGITLEAEEADSESTMLSALSGLLSRTDALLAIPDSNIYRRGNIKAILITAFRHQKPLVGYSDAFTQAGALASLYSTPAQIGKQAANSILTSPAAVLQASSPQQFTLSINYNVAQSLAIRVGEESGIRQQLLSEVEAR